MISYSVVAQAAVDSSAMWLGILAAVGTMLTVAGTAMKRMVDLHFEDRKELKARVATLEKAEDDAIRRIAQLETQLEHAKLAQTQQTQLHNQQITSLRQSNQLALNEKDREIERLQQDVNALRQQLDGVRDQLAAISTQHEMVVTERNTLREENARLHAEAQELQDDIRSLVRENTLEVDMRKAFEQRLHDAGVDTQELVAIKEDILERLKKAGDDPL